MTGNSGGSGSINGNVIGLAADGNGALGNAGDGITISSLSNHVLEIRGNVIASNLYNGVTANAGVVEVVANRIGVNVAGNAARGNVTGVGVGGAVVSIRENQISGNETGITANSNVAEIEILDNRIGTDVAGNVAIGNTSSGLRISRAAPGLALGSPGHGNQISGNYRGITLDDITAEVIVQGNNIGLNAARTAKLGNVETAMLFGGNAHQIGGIAAGAGNVIAGNGSPAMRIGDGGGHHIEGNFIGTNAALASGLGNGFGGLRHRDRDCE